MRRRVAKSVRTLLFSPVGVMRQVVSLKMEAACQKHRQAVWAATVCNAECLFCRRERLRHGSEFAYAHTEQSNTTRQIHAFQPEACMTPYRGCIGSVLGDRGVTRDALEVVETQLDADGPARVALALKVSSYLLAEPREHGAKLRTVVHGVQIALESGLAAHAHRFAFSHYRALIPAPAGVVQPGAVALAKVFDQPVAL